MQRKNAGKMDLNGMCDYDMERTDIVWIEVTRHDS